MRAAQIVLSLLSFLAFSALADISVVEPKARATFALASTGAVYMDIVNSGEHADRLTHASVAADIAAKVEIHTMVMNGDMMQMRELEDGLPLAAGSTSSLAAGGNHIMLMGLAGPLNDGESFTITLHFEKAESISISVPIIKM